VVIGAGQAGLAAAHSLRRHFEPGRGFVVFDHNPGPDDHHFDVAPHARFNRAAAAPIP
jgi:cation diffusion facilitator CzcD-associated flavoprotein CzcO